MMTDDAQIVATGTLAATMVAFLLLFQRAMHRSMRLYPMSFGSRPASRKMAAGDSPALYLHMTSMRKLSAYRICDALTLSTAGRLAKYARSFAVNFPSTILSSPYTA